MLFEVEHLVAANGEPPPPPCFVFAALFGQIPGVNFRGLGYGLVFRECCNVDHGGVVRASKLRCCASDGNRGADGGPHLRACAIQSQTMQPRPASCARPREDAAAGPQSHPAGTRSAPWTSGTRMSERGPSNGGRFGASKKSQRLDLSFILPLLPCTDPRSCVLLLHRVHARLLDCDQAKAKRRRPAREEGELPYGHLQGLSMR